MQHRGLRQADLARSIGWTTSNLSRIVQGKRELPRYARSLFATVLECSPADLLQSLDTPVPERRTGGDIKAASLPGFEQRLNAVLTMMGLERIEALLEFLTTGSYASMPAPVARRLRNILEPP
jgi:DNA-binding Xre family transcriptional regulator